MEDHLTPPIELGEEISPQRQQQQNRQQEQQSSYNIKLHMRGELRRIQLPVCTVAALQQAIRAIYRDFGGGKLFYKDDDGDTIAFCTDGEMATMFSYYKAKWDTDTARVFVEESAPLKFQPVVATTVGLADESMMLLDDEIDYFLYAQQQLQQQKQPPAENSNNANNGNGQTASEQQQQEDQAAPGLATKIQLLPPRVLHPNILCDICDDQIRGHRFKCLFCEDFDLCERCERTGAHPDHAMMRLVTPDTQKPAGLMQCPPPPSQMCRPYERPPHHPHLMPTELLMPRFARRFHSQTSDKSPSQNGTQQSNNTNNSAEAETGEEVMEQTTPTVVDPVLLKHLHHKHMQHKHMNRHREGIPPPPQHEEHHQQQQARQRQYLLRDGTGLSQAVLSHNSSELQQKLAERQQKWMDKLAKKATKQEQNYRDRAYRALHRLDHHHHHHGRGHLCDTFQQQQGATDNEGENAAAESGQVDAHQKQQQQQEERSQTSGGGNFLREIGHQVQQALLNFGIECEATVKDHQGNVQSHLPFPTEKPTAPPAEQAPKPPAAKPKENKLNPTERRNPAGVLERRPELAHVKIGGCKPMSSKVKETTKLSDLRKAIELADERIQRKMERVGQMRREADERFQRKQERVSQLRREVHEREQKRQEKQQKQKQAATVMSGKEQTQQQQQTTPPATIDENIQKKKKTDNMVCESCDQEFTNAELLLRNHQQQPSKMCNSCGLYKKLRLQKSTVPTSKKTNDGRKEKQQEQPQQQVDPVVQAALTSAQEAMQTASKAALGGLQAATQIAAEIIGGFDTEAGQNVNRFGQSLLDGAKSGAENLTDKLFTVPSAELFQAANAYQSYLQMLQFPSVPRQQQQKQNSAPTATADVSANVQAPPVAAEAMATVLVGQPSAAVVPEANGGQANGVPMNQQQQTLAQQFGQLNLASDNGPPSSPTIVPEHHQHPHQQQAASVVGGGTIGMGGNSSSFPVVGNWTDDPSNPSFYPTLDNNPLTSLDYFSTSFQYHEPHAETFWQRPGPGDADWFHGTTVFGGLPFNSTLYTAQSQKLQNATATGNSNLPNNTVTANVNMTANVPAAASAEATMTSPVVGQSASSLEDNHRQQPVNNFEQQLAQLLWSQQKLNENMEQLNAADNNDGGTGNAASAAEQNGNGTNSSSSSSAAAPLAEPIVVSPNLKIVGVVDIDDLEVNGSRKKEFSICSANTDSDVEILNEEDEEEEAQPLEDNGVGLETEPSLPASSIGSGSAIAGSQASSLLKRKAINDLDMDLSVHTAIGMDEPPPSQLAVDDDGQQEGEQELRESASNKKSRSPSLSSIRSFSSSSCSSNSSNSSSSDSDSGGWMVVKKESFKRLCDFYEKRRRVDAPNADSFTAELEKERLEALMQDSVMVQQEQPIANKKPQEEAKIVQQEEKAAVPVAEMPKASLEEEVAKPKEEVAKPKEKEAKPKEEIKKVLAGKPKEQMKTVGQMRAEVNAEAVPKMKACPHCLNMIHKHCPVCPVCKRTLIETSFAPQLRPVPLEQRIVDIEQLRKRNKEQLEKPREEKQQQQQTTSSPTAKVINGNGQQPQQEEQPAEPKQNDHGNGTGSNGAFNPGPWNDFWTTLLARVPPPPSQQPSSIPMPAPPPPPPTFPPTLDSVFLRNAPGQPQWLPQAKPSAPMMPTTEAHVPPVKAQPRSNSNNLYPDLVQLELAAANGVIDELCTAGQPHPRCVNHPSGSRHTRLCPWRHFDKDVQKFADELVSMGYDNCNGWLFRLLEQTDCNMDRVFELIESDQVHKERQEQAEK